MLLDLLLHMTGTDGRAAGRCADPMVETAWFPASKVLVVMNNSDQPQEACVEWPEGSRRVSLAPEALEFIEV